MKKYEVIEIEPKLTEEERATREQALLRTLSEIARK